MFALNLYWTWSGRIIHKAARVCIDAALAVKCATDANQPADCAIDAAQPARLALGASILSCTD